MEGTSKPTTVTRHQGSASSTSGDLWIMAALWAVLVGGLFGAGLGLWDIVGGDRLSLPVELAEGAGSVSPMRPAGTASPWSRRRSRLTIPSVWHRLLLGLPAVLVASAGAFVGWQLLGVARCMRTGDLFSETSVRRIRLSGIVTLRGRAGRRAGRAVHGASRD